MASKFLRVTKKFAQTTLLAPTNVRAAAPLVWRRHVSSDPKRSTTDNFVSVVTQDNENPLATVGLYVGAGSSKESREDNGVANFAEKLLLTSNPELLAKLDSMGASVNSEVTRDQSAIWVNCLSKDATKVVGLLGQLVDEVKTDEAAMARARACALAELEAAGQDMRGVAMDYMHAIAFQGTSYAQPVQGTTANIKSFTGQQLSEFFSKHYEPLSMHVTAVGGVDHAEVLGAAEQALGGRESSMRLNVLVPRFTSGEVKNRDDTMPLAHIAVCVEGPWADSGDNLNLLAMSTIMGSYDRSYGASKLASPLQASAAAGQFAQSFSPIHVSYENAGLWGLYMTSPCQQVEDCIEGLQLAWMNANAGLSEAEVYRARKLMLQQWNLMENNSELKSHDLARNSRLLSRVIGDEEMRVRIGNITPASVRDVIKTHVYDKSPAVVGIGPVEMMSDFTRIRINMYSIFS